MILLILLLVAIVIMIFATGVAIRLTKVTKLNASWVLITIALVLMCVMRIDEFLRILGYHYDWEWKLNMPMWMYGWIGVATSLCLAIGVMLIKKILSYMTIVERQRRSYESRILSAVIKAEEKQRQHFSKELHDGLGPLLSSVKMSISALSYSDTQESQRQILENTDRTIAMAIKSLREISNNLSPHILENFGISRAVGSFINRLAIADSGLKIEFQNNLKEFRFNPQTEIITYRVVCELLNNTIKHSQASIVKLDMYRDRNSLSITYYDNGKGFDTELLESEGMGLSNIRSRISSIDGEFNIKSQPGQGTWIDIRLPI